MIHRSTLFEESNTRLHVLPSSIREAEYIVNIEWTPNVIASKVTIEGDKVRVRLGSCTPNFRCFQIQAGDGAWYDCSEDVERSLSKEVPNRFTFRTMNWFGVAGPDHRVEIARERVNVSCLAIMGSPGALRWRCALLFHFLSGNEHGPCRQQF